MADTARTYRLPRRVLIFRNLFRPVFRGAFHLLGRVSLAGFENIPTRGPYLIAVNHVSLYEPPLVLAFWPEAPEAVGAADIWERTGQATLAKLYGGIPVHRGEYDRRLLENMITVLNSGRPLLIAPEGGRSHTRAMRQGLPGVAYVVNKAQVPVVPVGVIGADDDFLKRALRGERPEIKMIVGRPFCLPAIHGRGEARREALQRNADLVMLNIASLLPAEYHGLYGKQEQPQSETA